MSARSLAARALMKTSLEQAAARQRLAFHAQSMDPDPAIVLADIARLTQTAEDAGYAIRAAQAVTQAVTRAAAI